MSEMVDWLRAQFDEDERVARAAIRPTGSGTWVFEEYDDEVPNGVMRRCWQVSLDGVAPDLTDGPALIGPSPMRHIAHWSPARALAEVEAKRRILAIHRPHEQFTWECVVCSPQSCGCVGGGDLYPCETVRLLALSCADQPGYREEWRP